jgi:hypothetical protein
MAKDKFEIDPAKETTIEAEEYSKQKGEDVHAWKKVKGERADIPAHIIAAPGNNTVYDVLKKDFEKRSPYVSYSLKFAKEGTYYVWICGLGEAGGASVAVGFDGVLLKSQAVKTFGPKWGSLGSFPDGSRITVTVDKPGEHTLALWMVEDGVRIDKVILVADRAYVPNTP